MGMHILREPEIPEGILRLLAMPVARSSQTWYLGVHMSGDRDGWTVATLWNEPPRDSPSSRCWGLALRGIADQDVVLGLIAELRHLAKRHGCTTLVTDALALDSPFDHALQDAGFIPLRGYRTVEASTLDALRGLGLGVRGEVLQATGWGISSPRDDELPLLMASFQHELGQVPPHLFYLAEEPGTARPIDQTLVLRRQGHTIAALVARCVGRSIDVQGLVCHSRWRKHRALSWLLAESTARWPWIADNLTFSYPEDNSGMADIANRIGARLRVRRHDLLLKTD